MGLYRNIVHWDYSLDTGDHVAWINYPFFEYKLDPIFKVLALNEEDYSIDLEVVFSDFLEVGSIYRNQIRNGLRRVKLTSVKEDLTYNKNV